MTRKEIEQEYAVTNGRIASPGKFEGEMVYVPFYWEANDGTVLRFRVTPEDKIEFPELIRRRVVRLVEDGQGFVREV
jgi:hypothetical protein